MSKLSELQQWLLHTPLGGQVLDAERIFYHNNVQNIFGYYALQIDLPKINFLANNKISARYIINHDIKCDNEILPFESNSIDLIVCPHTLEFMNNYQDFIAECHRILMPRGKIIITSFNKKSFFGLFNKFNKQLKDINYVSLDQLKGQLDKLSFQINGGKFFNYLPPLKSHAKLNKLKFLDKIGDRWFPTFANCYAIIASKELITPTLIKPNKQQNQTAGLKPNFGIASRVNSEVDSDI